MFFKIRTKLVVAFLAIILPYIIIAGLISLYNMNIIYNGARKVDAVTGEMHKAHRLQLALDMAIMPVNDYISTGKKEYIERFGKASAEVENWLAGLEVETSYLGGLFPDEVNEERRILEEVKVSWEKIKGLAGMAFEINHPVGSRQAASIMEEIDYGLAYPALQRLNRWHEIDENEYREAREGAKKALRHVVIILIAGGLILTLFGGFFAFFYSRAFVRPIEVIHEAADSIAMGNFKARLDLKTGDEMQQLAGAMNEMAAQLDAFYGTLETQIRERTRALEESEEKYRTMIDNSNDMIWTVDGAGRFTFINKKAEEVTDRSSEEWLGKTFDPLVVEDDLPAVRDIHGRIMNGEKVHYEVRAKNRDGSVIYLSVNATPMTRDGEIVGSISFGRDVTEKKRAEIEMEKRNAFVETLLENAPIGFAVNTIDDGKPVYVSRRFASSYGVTQEELQGLGDFFDKVYIDPVVREQIRKRVMADIVSGDPARMRWENVPIASSDGGCRYISAVNIPLAEQNLMISTVWDVTDRYQAEKLLRENQEIFSRFMEFSPIYVFFKDENIRALRLSKNFEEMLGRPMSELVGKSMEELFPPEMAKSMVADDMRVIKEGKPVTVEEEFNGRFYSTIKFPIVIDERPRYIAGYTIDITERKAAERDIREQLKELTRWQKATIGREFRMHEIVEENKRLRDEIDKLKQAGNR